MTINIELILQLLNIVAIPIIGYIITQINKLDSRIFDLQRTVLTRTEYLEEIRSIRRDLQQAVDK
jgi:hypothetical protein